MTVHTDIVRLEGERLDMADEQREKAVMVLVNWTYDTEWRQRTTAMGKICGGRYDALICG